MEVWKINLSVSAENDPEAYFTNMGVEQVQDLGVFNFLDSFCELTNFKKIHNGWFETNLERAINLIEGGLRFSLAYDWQILDEKKCEETKKMLLSILDLNRTLCFANYDSNFVFTSNGRNYCGTTYGNELTDHLFDLGICICSQNVSLLIVFKGDD